ncbi:Up-regulated during septation-domain-containing protein [Infundibulicybe gibba]|nr:Up-regulated during septation-domain-containing protein [Infundibulicybe gibba]
MNGVRRFLGAATSSSVPPTPQTDSPITPLVFSPKQPIGPSWPPQSPDKPKPPLPPDADDDPAGNTSFQSSRSSTSVMSSTRGHIPFSTPPSGDIPLSPPYSPLSGPSSSRLSQPNHQVLRKPVAALPGTEFKRLSGLNTRDELLISLLASEAIVDSREFEILCSEEVEELKKEQQVLTSRRNAMANKLSLEVKIRDAAVSLAKVNASNKKISKRTDEQLEAANRRVDAAQKELWRITERVNDILKRLLEHRAGVLSLSVRSMEKKMAPNNVNEGEDSGYDTSNRSTLMSAAASSVISVSSSKARFDGAHLFAGHADAVVPKRTISPESAAAAITALEEKLKAATESLMQASRKQADMSRELTVLQLEKQELETTTAIELQSAEDTINALENELPRLEGLDAEVQGLLAEKAEWEQERAELMARAGQVEQLQTRLASSQSRDGEAAETEQILQETIKNHQQALEKKDDDIQRLQAEWDAERAEWEQEKVMVEDEKMEDLARLKDEMDRLREEDAVALRQANDELDSGLFALRNLIQQHGIVLFTRESSLKALLGSVGTHLETVHAKLAAHTKDQGEWDTLRKKLEDDVRSGLEKREALTREIEAVRRERDGGAVTRASEIRSKEHDAMSPSIPSAFPLPSDFTGDAASILSILQPLWSVLPSPEARASKFNSSRNFRTGSPTPGNPNGGSSITSLSELDVRSLKALYDTTRNGQAMSPQTSFTIEGFAARVQALIADDRALIERLLRARKLAQEGNTALETYQKQVRTLEERNMTLSMRQAAMQDEILQLQHAIDRIDGEKREVERHAAEQAETCRQLTEANNMLSARTLTLAEEAASAPEMVRKQLEGQLAECKAALDAARKEIDAMRMSEQSQRIALLDELNSMQTENGSLRAQLRASKK